MFPSENPTISGSFLPELLVYPTPGSLSLCQSGFAGIVLSQKVGVVAVHQKCLQGTAAFRRQCITSRLCRVARPFVTLCTG